MAQTTLRVTSSSEIARLDGAPGVAAVPARYAPVGRVGPGQLPYSFMQQHWTDREIRKRSEDSFGRSSYADRAAELIASVHTWEDSAVFGLTGQWGSGKTSMLYMIDEALVEAHPDYKVVRFTPWATNDVAGVLADFYSSIASALPTNRVADARKLFGSLLKMAAPAGKLVPFAGELVAGALETSGQSLTAIDPWNVAFDKAVTLLKDNHAPILVIVDDIDRLQGDELLCVLKVIRLLGRFPGVQYLLAYDQEALAHSLHAAGAVHSPTGGRRYVEKIVQYTLPVPQLLDVQLNRRLTESLTTVIRAHRDDPGTGPMHRVIEARAHMRALLITPRAIDRFVAQVNYDLGLHEPGEIDDQDLIILALLRTAFPPVYDRLSMHQDQLITGATEGGRGDVLPKGRWDASEVLNDLPQPEALRALEILKVLFPKLSHHTAVAARKRICTPDYFGRYFAMGILDAHDIADSTVFEAVRAACEGDGTALAGLLTNPEIDVATLAFDKACDAYNTVCATSDAESASAGMFASAVPIVDDIASVGGVMFDLREMVVRWVGGVVMRRLADDIDSEAVLAALNTAELNTQLAVVRSASHASDTTPPWLKAIHERMLPTVANEFLEHLRQGDNAHFERGELLTFLRNASAAGVDLEPARNAIAESARAGEFGIADLASRFVYQSLGDHLQADPDGYSRIAPNDDDPWYDQSVVHGIDESDGTWVNRKRYAAGRFKRPDGATGNGP